MTNNRVYFPNLNGLRFIAAAMVILWHIEQFRDVLGLSSNYDFYPQQFGKLGVVLFFVLSGFLISYLLFVEEKVHKTIFIKEFYIRRILRIWPIYYLLLILSCFVFPYVDFLDYGWYNEKSMANKNFLLYFIFMPNFAVSLPFISQAWSVGVEEQFYLIWPILMKYVKNKYVLLFSVIFIYLFTFIIIKENQQIHLLNKLYPIITWLKIDCMAIGGIFALLLFEKRKVLNFLYSKSFQIFIYFITTVLLLSKEYFPFYQELFAILFGIIILNLASNPKTIISLESKKINYLGKISYGLYMYHPLVTLIIIKISIIYNFHENRLLVMFLIFSLVILCSHYSYEYFEKFFIKRKHKFSKIISG
ncbi:MAG: acyltransferase family protein [Flavobacteriales bacterium]